MQSVRIPSSHYAISTFPLVVAFSTSKSSLPTRLRSPEGEKEKWPSAFKVPASKRIKLDHVDVDSPDLPPVDPMFLNPMCMQPIHEVQPRIPAHFAPMRSHKYKRHVYLPCRLVNDVSRMPLRRIPIYVKNEYTCTLKEASLLPQEERTKQVLHHVRVMGNSSELYFVAKDICLLLHIRKGNVAKAIGSFTTLEKARMPVQCPRKNGTFSTHVLTVLTLLGVERLFSRRRSKSVQHVRTWLDEQIQEIQNIQALMCLSHPALFE